MVISKIIDFITGKDVEIKTETKQVVENNEPKKSAQELEQEQIEVERAKLDKLWNQLQKLPAEKQGEIVDAINLLKGGLGKTKSQGIKTPGQGRNI